jgi:hemerythrin-like domain-containing protein
VDTSTKELKMTASATRLDLYANIHKGLRAFMAHTLVRVGRLDPHDPAEVDEVGAEVQALLEICRRHLQHENEWIHPALQARAPGSVAQGTIEHEGHLVAIDGLRQMLERLSHDAAAAPALYAALSRFVAENFEHMQREETEHNAVLWATHTDEELYALHERILANIRPEEMQVALRWMLPHLAPAERAEVLAGMRRSAPEEAFQNVLSLIRPLLGGRDWRKLSLALGL